MAAATPDKSFKLEARLRPKLIAAPLAESTIDKPWLQSGRLPVPGKDEIVAGAGTSRADQVAVGDRSLQVVGRLKPDLALFDDCYLIPASDDAQHLLPRDDPTVFEAILIDLKPEQFQRREVQEQLEKALPSDKYTLVMTTDRLDGKSYYRYLTGLAVMLLGGSGALIGLYRWGADRSQRPSSSIQGLKLDGEDESDSSGVRRTWLAAPLLEIRRRPRLVWGVHLCYFGIVIAGSALIHELPDLQTVFLSTVQDAISAKSGVLAAAGQAYGSGSIPRAAFVTFVINFFLGSLACITLPSIVLPGSGTVVAGLRCTLWGLILAPTLTVLALSMLPHSGTMLLEGEGYILATIFGLLIPIHIVQSSLGGTPLSRFGRVILLNIKASLLVALVLAVAAVYEATEVILMNR
jgi:hypothetical protein